MYFCRIPKGGSRGGGPSVSVVIATIFLGGLCTEDIEFMETADNEEEGGTIVSKLGGKLCVPTGGVTLGGRGGNNSKGGVLGRGEIKNLVKRSVGLMVVGENSSQESMSGLSMKAAMRCGLCHCNRDSAISIMKILTSRLYSCSISALLGLKKDSSTGTKVSVSWRASCSQTSRRGFILIQDELTQPRASSVFCSVQASNGRGVSSNSITVWWLGRDYHKGREMFEHRLWVLFRDMERAVE